MRWRRENWRLAQSCHGRHEPVASSSESLIRSRPGLLIVQSRRGLGVGEALE